ncbi:hypothetical protein ACSBOX_02485 [Arthrobacter sp. KN11-1C]|uniref:hypothetical protein n=1 Tax=Arthrobacter sp. KN11-1C TaxID=3445774 RepID=UPI003F9FCDBF
MLRPVLLAVFGALAWLLWLAGPSQAADVLPAIPAVPSASVSLPPVPLADRVGPLINQLASAVPNPSHIATVPGTVVHQLSDHAVKPVVGAIDTLPSTVKNTIRELRALPDPQSVPGSQRVIAAIRHQGPTVQTAPAAHPNAESGTDAESGTATVCMSPLPAAVQTRSEANTRNSGFTADAVVPMPVAVFATSGASPVQGGPPPDTPAPAAASPHEAGSASGPEGGSAFGAADLPEQRALAPPPGHGPIPDLRQTPSTEPAFDPGSSPD